MTDAAEAENLTKRLAGILNAARAYCADEGTKDNARLFFGGKPGSVFYQGTITTVDQLQQLPGLQEPEGQPEEPQQNLLDQQPQQPRQPREAGKGWTLQDKLSAQLDDDRQNFDLLGFVLHEYGGRMVKRGRAVYVNPCPVCGHNDCFQVAGAIWGCHSSAHRAKPGQEHAGGTIIDLLQDKGMTLAGAMDHFKFGIMGYDRDEWRRAWRESQRGTPADDFQWGDVMTGWNGDPAPRQPEDQQAAADQPQQPEGEADQPEDQEAKRAAALAEHLQRNAAGYMDAFGKAVTESANTPPIPTGFPGLDKNLGGGMFEGFYVIGAISSLGKTSWALQIIDQIAEQGRDVLVFSLEMARYELMAKSISRLTFQHTQRNGISKEHARTTRGITNGANYARYTQQDFDVLDAAETRYRTQIAPHIWILEGIGDIGVNQVRAAVKEHTDIMGKRPGAILIDYLQILAPYSDPMHPNRTYTDKQCVDKNVLELKRISRDFKIPVIAISSFNRDNYSAPVNTAAFKESGSVEYSADVLIGLQYHGMERQEKINRNGETVTEGDNDPQRLARIGKLFRDNDALAKEGKPITVDVKILKNRNGGRGMSDTMQFYPMFNTFEENTGGFTAVDDDVSSVFSKKRRDRI